MSDLRRRKMCTDKSTFYTAAQAGKLAVRFGQKAYECPICFGWHLTRLADWKEEYVPVKKYENLKREHERILALLQKEREKTTPKKGEAM